MFRCLLRFSWLAGITAACLCAQDVRVRPAERLEMPAHIDSNSPAFWRGDRLFWFGSTGHVMLNDGPDLAGPWQTSETFFDAAYPAPHWIEALWAEDDGTLWGWYHAEPVGLFENSALTVPRIGAALSTDGGRVFRDFGIVLESGDAPDASAANGYFAGGHGDCSVILDEEKTYFYIFFGNYGGPTENQGVAVARMAFRDRFSPNGALWKYCDGKWEQAGIGGRVTPIFPVKRGWQHRDPDAFWGPSVHWNTHLKCYVMLLNHAQGQPGWSQEGVYVSFCSDLNKPDTWTEPKQILDKLDLDDWSSFYPQVMGLQDGGTDTRASRTARLYVNGISKWEIDFIAKPPPPPPPPTEDLPPEPPPPVDPGPGPDPEPGP